LAFYAFSILIIGLQKGDEVVMINGTHVEGMTTTEVVNIIKGIDGDVNVVAKRGDATPIVRASGAVAPPGNGEWYSCLFNIKNISVHSSVALVPTAGYVMRCCCNTRDASTFWFTLSLILEAIGLIGIIVQGMVTVASVIIIVAYLILSIQGLIGCVKINQTLVNAGRVGYIIKSVLQAIGIIFIIALWGSFDEYVAVDDINYFPTVVVIISVIYFIFNVAGAVVAGFFINEIDVGIWQES